MLWNDLNRKGILICGLLAIFGATGGMVADVFSLWIPGPDILQAADQPLPYSLMTLLSQKSSHDLFIGSLLGILTLPLHMFGFYLMAAALKPANRFSALIFFIAACMMATVGAGFHGSIALVGETARAGDAELFRQQMGLFIPWWWILTLGFIFVSLLLALFISKPGTLYPRWSLVFTPLSTALFGSLLLWILPQVNAPAGLLWFLVICGINLPLFIFHLVTTWVMLKHLH